MVSIAAAMVMILRPIIVLPVDHVGATEGGRSSDCLQGIYILTRTTKACRNIELVFFPSL